MDEVLTPHSDLTLADGNPTDNADIRIVTLPALPRSIWFFMRICIRIFAFIKGRSRRT